MHSDLSDGVLRAAADEPAVAALILTGSLSTGCQTEHSDVDLCLITRGPVSELSARFVTPVIGLDLVCMSLADFRAFAEIGSTTEWERYSMRWARVLLDRTSGVVPLLCADKGTMPADVAQRRAPGALDAYLNNYYRALKNQRDGRDLEARLDAAEAVNRYLTALFLLFGRLRPYNKYLFHELRTQPLPAPLTEENMAQHLDGALRSGDLHSHAALFGLLEPAAREKGLGRVIDAWNPRAVAWMRTGEATT